LETEEIKTIPRVVAIGDGKEKLETIQAALKTNLLDVLYTDDRTASILLK